MWGPRPHAYGSQDPAMCRPSLSAQDPGFPIQIPVSWSSWPPPFLLRVDPVAGGCPLWWEGRPLARSLPGPVVDRAGLVGWGLHVCTAAHWRRGWPAGDFWHGNLGWTSSSSCYEAVIKPKGTKTPEMQRDAREHASGMGNKGRRKCR